MLKRMLALFLFCGCALARAESGSLPEFHPDAVSVQHCGPGYRYPQEGWIVLHIEGSPHERGVQHGTLLAPEIKEHLRCLSAFHQSSAPEEGWRHLRTLVNALFLRHFDKEYLEEMQGIADGAAAHGCTIDKRACDLLDIVALNLWSELMTLDGALSALPTGLEDVKFPDGPGKALPHVPTGEHCSAFVATGPATADGKIVLGHISMYELYPSSFFNVWIDVKPEKGHRILMQGYPGAIQSGLDFYINDAGLIVCETTIGQTRFNPDGIAEASQIRKALQYSESIDQVVEVLKANGDGLYSNEWLMGDTKTNEIAMFEQGTHAFKLWRSSKNEWFGGTEGFYWGDNNVKDRAVRLETRSTLKGEPLNMLYHQHDRDEKWVELYRKNKGHIDADFGRMALTTPPLAAYTSADTKVTTTDMAKNMVSWARFGPPMGRVWHPEDWEIKSFPEVRPMVPNPWTVVRAFPSTYELTGHGVHNRSREEEPPKAADLGGKHRGNGGDWKLPGKGWHGTILPKTDGDIWLAAAFAEYQGFARHDHNRPEVGSQIFGWRANYFYGALSAGDTPLTQIHENFEVNGWYRIASAKGCLALHELRMIVGDPKFAEAMDAFGTAHAGQEVTTAEFIEHMQKATGKDLKAFSDYWLKQTGLPRAKLGAVTITENAGAKKTYAIKGSVSAESGVLPVAIDVTVETEKGETTTTVPAQPNAAEFSINSDDKPVRVIVNKYGRNAFANGGQTSLGSFRNHVDRTIVVYGTVNEEAANKEAAEALRKVLINYGPNIAVPVRSDKDVTSDELRTNHVLLIGRPDCNRVSEKWSSNFPVQFHQTSFTVNGETYAHGNSAIAVAAANPCDGHLSTVMIGGLSADAVFTVAQRFAQDESRGGEIAIFENGGAVHHLVLPAPELIYDVNAHGNN